MGGQWNLPWTWHSIHKLEPGFRCTTIAASLLGLETQRKGNLANKASRSSWDKFCFLVSYFTCNGSNSNRRVVILATSSHSQSESKTSKQTIMLYSNLLLTLTRTSEQEACHLANMMWQIDGHVIVRTLYEQKGQSLWGRGRSTVEP